MAQIHLTEQLVIPTVLGMQVLIQQRLLKELLPLRSLPMILLEISIILRHYRVTIDNVADTPAGEQSRRKQGCWCSCRSCWCSCRSYYSFRCNINSFSIRSCFSWRNFQFFPAASLVQVYPALAQQGQRPTLQNRITS